MFPLARPIGPTIGKTFPSFAGHGLEYRQRMQPVPSTYLTQVLSTCRTGANARMFKVLATFRYHSPATPAAEGPTLGFRTRSLDTPPLFSSLVSPAAQDLRMRKRGEREKRNFSSSSKQATANQKKNACAEPDSPPPINRCCRETTSGRGVPVVQRLSKTPQPSVASRPLSASSFVEKRREALVSGFHGSTSNLREQEKSRHKKIQ